MTENSKLRDFDPDAAPDSDKTLTVAHVDEAYDIYGGRATGSKSMADVQPPYKGWLGNPHRLAECDGGREEAIEKFEQDFIEKLRDDRLFCASVATLSGKVVACHCRSQTEDEPACHLDVVREHLLSGVVYRIAHDAHDLPLTDFEKTEMADPEAVLEVVA